MSFPPDPGSGGGRAGLPLLSGLLLALSFPPSPFPLLAFAAPAPLALALERLPSGAPGATLALRAGFLAGVSAWGLLLLWIPGALLPVAPLLAIPAWGATVALLGMLTAAVAWSGLLLRRRGVPVALALPLAWTAGEWLRAHAGPLAIPWLPLGGALVPLPALAAPAEWVGVHGLTLWVAAVGCGAVGVAVGGNGSTGGSAEGGRRAIPVGIFRRSPVHLPVALALLLVVPPLAGWLRNGTLVLEPALEVAAVQLRPGTPPGEPAPTDLVRRMLLPLLEELPPGAAELVLLPEAVLDGVLSARGEPPELLDPLVSTAARIGAPVLAGGYAAAGDAPGVGPGEGAAGSAVTQEPGVPGAVPGPVLNAAIRVAVSGEVGVAHAKQHLVPGIEAGLPPPFHRLPGGRRRGGAGMVSGDTPGTVEAGGAVAGILVCYESAFPGAAILPRRAGARVLVSLTHEGWFGAGGTPPDGGGFRGLPGSVARAQHVAHLQMRAVETRAGIARAALDGEALIVDPLGRVVSRGGEASVAVVRGTLHTVRGVPLHVKTGDLAGSGALVALIALLLSGRGGRKHPARGPMYLCRASQGGDREDPDQLARMTAFRQPGGGRGVA